MNRTANLGRWWQYILHKDGWMYVIFSLFCFFFLNFGPTFLGQGADGYWAYDQNIYHLIGRGWMNGLLPYKELSDIKGPLVFLEYGLGSLITPYSFLGVCIIHACVLGCGLLYAYKTASLYIGEMSSFALTCFYTSWMMCFYDGCPSEVIWTLEHVTLYWILKNHVQRQIRYGIAQLFMIGASVGAALMLKFNYSAFWVPVFLLILYQSRKELWRTIFILFSGVFLVVGVVLAYFGIRGGAGDLWQEYVASAYSYGQGSWEQSALVTKNIGHFSSLAHPLLRDYYLWGLLPGILMVFAWVIPGGLPLGKVAKCLLLVALLLDFCICMRGNRCYVHYYFPFFVYNFLSLITIVLFVRKYCCSIYIIHVAQCLACLVPIVGSVYILMVQEQRNIVHKTGEEKFIQMLVELLKRKTFIVMDGYHVALYRWTGTIPCFCHFIEQLVPEGKQRRLEEIAACLKSDTPPQYIISWRGYEEWTHECLAGASVTYHQVDLAEKGFPTLPPTDWCAFILYEQEKNSP